MVRIVNNAGYRAARTNTKRGGVANPINMATPAAAVIKSVEFEVFGKVQGVFFRKVRELKVV